MLITFNLPSSKPGMSGFGWLKCKLAGIAWSCIAIKTLAKAARPDEGSGCPMLDLVEPTSSGADRPLLQKTSVTLFASCGSPAAVPVPWSSTYDTVLGLTPASLYTSINSLFCISPDGNVMPSNRVQLPLTQSNLHDCTRQKCSELIWKYYCALMLLAECWEGHLGRMPLLHHSPNIFGLNVALCLYVALRLVFWPSRVYQQVSAVT